MLQVHDVKNTAVGGRATTEEAANATFFFRSAMASASVRISGISTRTGTPQNVSIWDCVQVFWRATSMPAAKAKRYEQAHNALPSRTSGLFGLAGTSG